MIVFRISILCLLMIAAGCTKVDSEDIRTAGITADIEVTADDYATTVNTRLRAGNGIGAGRIVLSEGDQLTATLNGDSVNLGRSGTNIYTGVFDSSESGVELKVALIRDDGVDALNSSVLLPARFEIDSPDQSETYMTGDSITAVWSPSDPEKLITITYTFNCKPEGEESSPLDDVRVYSVADTGTHTTTVTHILNARGPQPILNGLPCPVKLEIYRTNDGELDGAFEGGGIDANRSKTVNITIVP